MRAAALSVCALAAVALAAPMQDAECTREMLIAATDAYAEAQAAGETSFDALSDATTYTENFEETDISGSILSKALKIDHKRSTHDTTQCATYTELIITDASHPYVLGTQMWFGDDGKVDKMETIVTDQGDWLFNAAGTLKYAEQEDWGEIPEDERDTREVIQAAADAYCDIFSDKSVEVPWGTPCARLEGGSYTGRGAPTDSCDVGIPDGIPMTNRRYVIDETLGAVDVMLTFADRLPDSHEFRVEKGKIRFVHTLTVM